MASGTARVHDFRRTQSGEPPSVLKGLEDFAPFNKTKAFIADRGFLVFERDTSLVEAFSQYMAQAARESCGRCAPCRVGTQRIRDLLQDFSGGSAAKGVLDSIEEIARQVTDTSLCGMGQSCARALLDALQHFRGEFKPLTPAQAVFQHSYVYTTAPCIEACPSKVDVPRYIDGVKGGKFDFALGVVLDKYPDGRHLRPGLCALLRDRLPAQRRRGSGGHPHAQALRRRSGDHQRPPAIHEESTAAQQARRGHRRRTGRHHLRLQAAARWHPGRCVRCPRKPPAGWPRSAFPVTGCPRMCSRPKARTSCASWAANSTTAGYWARASRLMTCWPRATTRYSSATARARAPCSASATKIRSSKAMLPASTSCSRCTSMSSMAKRLPSTATCWWSAAATWRWIACARPGAWAPARCI